jgi:hypothetical protein
MIAGASDGGTDFPSGPPGPPAWAPAVAWAEGLNCIVGPPATVVTNNNALYVCTTPHTAGATFDPTKFLLLLSPLVGPAAWQQAAAWASSTTYLATQPAALVTYNNGLYLCTTSHVAGVSFDPTKWLLIVQGFGDVHYQGTWNASTNTPALVSGVGTQGFYYRVSTAGATTIDGNSVWEVGDWIIFNGTTWDRLIGPSQNFSSLTISPVGRVLPGPQAGTLGQAGNADGVVTRWELNSFGVACHFSGIRYDGTLGAPTALLSADEIASFNAWGYNGASIVGPAAAIRFYAGENWSSGHQGTYGRISITPAGSTTLTDVMGLGSAGGLGGITIPPSVTGGDQGEGTLNVSALYINGNLVSPASNSNFGAATGSVGTAGLVPAPPAGAGFQGFLLGNAGWAFPPNGRGSIGGLTFSNDASTPLTVLDIIAGFAADNTAAAIMQLAAFKKSIASAWTVGSGNGGLDLGSAAPASSWLHCHLIMRVDTGIVDVLLSQAPGISGGVTCTNASPAVFTWSGGALPFQNGAPIVLGGTTAPAGFTLGTRYYVVASNQAAGTFELAATQGGSAINSTSTGTAVTATSNPVLPTNYTLWRRIFSVKTDGSSHVLPFTHIDEEVIWGTSVQDADISLSTTSLLQTLGSVPPGVKVLARVRYNYASGSAIILVSSPDEGTPAVGTPVYNGNVGAGVNELITRTNFAGQIRWVASSAVTAMTAVTVSYFDTRGRFA